METKNTLLFTLEREMSDLNPKAYIVLMKAHNRWKGEYPLYECWCETKEDALEKLLECVKFYDLFREVMWKREAFYLSVSLWVDAKVDDETTSMKEILNEKSLLWALSERRKEVDEFFGTDWFTSFFYIDHYWSNEVPVTEDCTITLRIPTTLVENNISIRWEFAWHQAEDAEAKVQELVTKLQQTNIGGEIILQEFEYNTPSDCYAVTVTELGEVYTNFS